MKKLLFFPLLALVSLSVASQEAQAPPGPDVAALAAERLPLLGHRNWIVIADSAYPQQTSPGIETIHVGGSQADAVKAVLAALAKARHLRPVFHLDAELAHLDDGLAPGSEDLRGELGKLLAGRDLRESPHEDIIAKLDAAGKAFKVLILKTDEVIPYSSVFIELDCGYWSPENEAALRERMNLESAVGSGNKG